MVVLTKHFDHSIYQGECRSRFFKLWATAGENIRNGGAKASGMGLSTISIHDVGIINS